jgi:nucleoside-diphosphate-sugar epimerase
VLITGGAGFAGAYTSRSLIEAGWRVIVYDLSDPRPESRFVLAEHAKDIAFERGSIDDWPRLFEVIKRYQPEAIVHMAAIMDIDFLDHHPMLALKVNVEGAVNTLEAARLNEVARLVMFSTIAVHGQKVYEPIDASHPTITARRGPLGAYGAAKLSSEAFAFAYNQSFGLDTRIVRPSALYGFGMSWFAPNYIKQIVEPAVLGQPVHLPTGGPVPRDYVNVVDLARLVEAVLGASEDSDRIFYAATGQPLRTGADVGAIVRDLVPGADVQIGDAWTDVDRAELPFRGEISIDNSREQLGWSPMFANLRDGIADYVDRLRAFLADGGEPTPRPSILNAPGG